MAVRRAPATLCPISSPLSPSLTPLFSTLFLLPFFFSHALLPRHTYVTLTLSTKPFSSLLFRLDRLIFLFQPSLLSLEFSHYRAFPQLRSATLLLPLHIFFPYDSAVANDSLEYLLDESFTFVGLLDKRVGKNGLLSRRRETLAPAFTIRRRYPF